MTLTLYIIWMVLTVVALSVYAKRIELQGVGDYLTERFGEARGMALNIIASGVVPLLVWALSPIAASILLLCLIAYRGYGLYRNASELNG